MEKNELNKVMKSNVPKFLLIGLLAIVVLLTLLFYVFFRFSPMFIVQSSGFAINSKNIARTLQSENPEEEEKRVKLLHINENDTIYQRLSSFYIGGEADKEINLDYPVYLVNNESVLNLSKDMTLFTNDYEEVGGYPNFTISDGKMYNQGDATRADANEYLFLKNKDDVFCSLKEIKLNTLLNEYSIPINSIINFTEDYISYYKFISNDEIEYETIRDVDLKSKVTLNGEEDTYENLLIKLKIKVVEPEVEKMNYNYDEENTVKEQVEENKEEVVEEDDSNRPVTEKDQNDEGVSLIDNRKAPVSETGVGKSSKSGKTIKRDPNYVTPEVSCTDLVANVYTVTTNLRIYDPSGAITKAVEFTFYDETGKVFNRVSALSSGTLVASGLKPSSRFYVEGTYTYVKDNGDKAIKTFYTGEIETKSLDSLETIDFSFSNGEIFSDKIKLVDLRINNNLNSEVLFGLSKISVVTDGNNYNLKASRLRELLRGGVVEFESDTNIKSNKVVRYEIKAFDRFGNSLRISRNSGETRTSMKAPYLTITPNTKDLLETKMKISIMNVDNVPINNAKYKVFNSEGTELKSENLENIPNVISIRNLDPNHYYIIRVYGDYNIKDGKGTYQNIIIGETKFTTLPISSLGLVYYNVKHLDTTFHSNKLKIKLDSRKTDTRLSGIMTYVKIKIMKDSEEVASKVLDENEIVSLIDGAEIEYEPDDLESKTDYKVEIETKATLGTVTEDIKTNLDYPSFKTNKLPAKVEIKNDFVTGEMIDFDVRIEDIDGAVLDNSITMEFRDANGNLLSYEKITTNEDFRRIIFNRLETNRTYTITFTAIEYNETDFGYTYKSNYVLEKWNIYTEEGISGKIQLTDLNKKEKENSINLVDMSTETKWYVYPNFNTSDYYGKEYDEVTETLTLGGHGNNRRCVYDLREYAGRTVTISFKAKVLYTNQYKTGRCYIQNAKTDKNRTEFTSRINQTDWNNYSQTLTIDESGFLGFYINGGSGIQIRELQVELGSVQTPYKKYDYYLDLHLLVNLTDLRGEIETKDYYIKTYKDGELVQTDRYEEIGDDNRVTDAIKQYILEENKEYRFDLVIKIRDREYVLDSQEVETPRGKEIRGIYNLDDYKLIQPFGHYIVFCDLDLSPTSLRFGYTSEAARVNFDGTLDFNGYTVTRKITQNYNYGMFGQLGKHSVIKNLVLNLYNNNSIEMSEFYGIFYVNHGTIENVRVNLVESTEKRNLYTEFLGYSNRGTINKFVINTQVPYYVNNRCSCGVYYNYGTLKNGYLYGEPIMVTGQTTENYSYERTVGGLACISTGAAHVQNVYSLINIIFDENQSTNGKESTANIIRTNQAYVDNIYSVGVGNTIQTAGGPTIYSNSGKVKECYYFADKNKVFGNSFNKKTTKLALVDSQYQNLMLNREGAFNVDEMIGNGFYPQIYMNDCMPRQDYIPLPEIKDEDVADVLSCKVLEQGSDSVKVEFVINNPSGEIITSKPDGTPGIVVQYLDTTIESQEYEDGKSRVIATLSNPKKYISSYSVLEITLEGAFTNLYSTSYTANERIINVDLYREINSVADWKTIPSHLDENYMLMKDLDFNMEGNTISITKAYLGKITGKDPSGQIHTISRIRSNRGIIYQLKGSISNLYVDTVLNVESDIEYNGLIEQLKGGIIDNVHVKNISLKPKNTRKGGGFYAGGIAGLVDTGGLIKNSSVTNPNISVQEKISTVRVGGMVGYAESAIFDNDFVRGADISIKYNIYSDGVGGLVGRGNPAYISNCYTTGQVFCDGDKNGGIIGQASTSGVLDKCYSTVDVTSYGDYNGGIVGYSITPTSCISIGNIYTRLGTDNVSRVSGYPLTRKVNYAYKDQKLNGYVVEDELDAYLISKEDLLDKFTYLNTIQWDSNYNYDDLENGYLPKLTYTEDNSKILPNQEEGIKIDESEGIDVLEIRIDDRQTSYADVRVTLSNPSELHINNIDIENMNITILSVDTIDGKTYITLRARPEKYYDSYKVEKVYYTDGEGEKSIIAHGRLECRFYKQIYSVEQWQDICKGDNKDTYQNYMIMNDLDFRGTMYENRVNYNITVGRLETQGESESDMVTIKGITLKNVSQQEGLIQKVSVNIQNIKFEDIHIYTGNNTGNNVGVIRRTEGNMKDIKFNNITIYGGTGSEAIPVKCKLSYVGCISSIHSDTANITVENSTITGVSYVGGYAGSSVNMGVNIEGRNITIEATGSYVGGIVGYNSAGTTHIHQDIRIYNSNITGNTYVGGIAGQTPSMINGTVYGDTPTVDGEGKKVYKMTVTGNDRTGGIAGYLLDGKDGGTITVENVRIKGTSNVGGAGGYSADAWSSTKKILNCEIEGKTNVGGVYGDCRSPCSNIYSIDNVVYATGNNVGGIAGYASFGNNAINNWVVDKVKIDGGAYVGGLIGYQRSGRVQNSYSYATVTATGNFAGGAIGFLNNNEMTAATLTSALLRVMVLRSKVTGMENIGGIYGGVSTEFYMPENFTKGLFVDAEVTALSQSKETSSMIIGLPRSRNPEINDVFIYAGSRLNSNIPSPSNDLIQSSQLWTLEQLQNQNTYTFLNTDWVKTTVSSGKYPILKSNQGYQRGVSLPTGSSSTTSTFESVDENLPKRSLSTDSKLLNKTDLLISNMSISNLLPEFTCYPISADEFNIDFNRTDEEAVLKLTIDGEEKVRENINQRTFTFKYNYLSKIGITIEKGSIATVSSISPDQVRKNLALVGTNKYYLRKGKLICNGQLVEGDYANLYEEFALTSTGDKVNIETRNTVANDVKEKLELIDAKPLKTYSYEGNNISTFGTYSIVNGNVKAQTYFVENNKLSIIDDSVSYKIGNVLIDSLNGNDYQTILGTDGKMMDLKQPISYPKHFYNSEIKEIVKNTSEGRKDILVMYNNGNVLNFDYSTGTQEFEEGENTDIGLIEYLKENLLDTENLYNDLIEKYEQSLELQLKLEQTPIEELLKNNEEQNNEGSVTSQVSTNSSSNSNKYTSVYNAVTKEYDIYQEDKLLNSEEEKVTSETDIIKTTELLSKFYYSPKAEIIQDNDKNGMIYFGISIIAIGITLIILNRNNTKSKKKRKAKTK